MLQALQNELIECNNIFDTEDILSYQLLLIKLFEISLTLEEETSSQEQRTEILNIFSSILKSQNLEKMLTIEDLNLLFNSDNSILDINNKSLYISLFNLIYSEWEDYNSDPDGNILTFKLKELISDFISQFMPEELNPISQEQLLNDNESLNNNFNNYETSYPIDDNLIITNKNYLKEYVLQKHLLDYECSRCGLTSWQNNPLMFYLHSKTGKYSNTNLQDLEFLCPNCYSQVGE